MTELEVRLRRELQNRAQRLAPADPRPLREPPARSPAGRARWMAPLAAMAAMVVVIGGLVLLQRTTPPVNGNGRTADPPLVAIAGISGSARAPAYSIEMMSPRTGRVAKVVPRASTGNGFALSPDSKNVFVVGPGSIQIRRISVATGKISFVADGAYPAVSPDSRYLAYVTGREFTDIAVRDLRTGGTRVINLRSLIGKSGILLNGGTVTWLGDGTEILAVPGEVGGPLVRTAGVTGTAGAASDGRALPARFRAVVIRVRPAGLSATRIWIAGRDPDLSVIRGDLSKQRSFLIARQGSQAAGTRKAVMGALVEATLRGRGVVERRIASLPARIMPVAIAPYGDRILYLAGHTPPGLWAAAIRNGRLLGQHHLFTSTPKFKFNQAAW
jgi:hypothetical protein